MVSRLMAVMVAVAAVLINQTICRIQIMFNTSFQLKNVQCSGVALPVIEELQTAWEAKCENPKYALYRDTINDGLAKIKKY